MGFLFETGQEERIELDPLTKKRVANGDPEIAETFGEVLPGYCDGRDSNGSVALSIALCFQVFFLFLVLHRAYWSLLWKNMQTMDWWFMVLSAVRGTIAIMIIDDTCFGYVPGGSIVLSVFLRNFLTLAFASLDALQLPSQIKKKVLATFLF